MCSKMHLLIAKLASEIVHVDEPKQNKDSVRI